MTSQFKSVYPDSRDDLRDKSGLSLGGVLDSRQRQVERFRHMDSRIPGEASIAMMPEYKLDNAPRFVRRIITHSPDGSCCILHESNRYRQAWNVFMLPVIMYVGTLMPFRIIFMEFHLPGKDGETWGRAELVLEFVFLIDLVLPFFFSYRDHMGNEVGQLHRIAFKYLRHGFLLNLLACFPPELAELIFQSAQSSDSNNLHKSVRFFKIQRAIRVIRLFRIVKVFGFLQDSPRYRWFKKLRGVRVTKNVFLLFWIVHLAACGLYLCAALHDDPRTTWPYRCFGSDITIAESDPVSSWLYSYYFALTIFTTVGFGDISPETRGETVCVCFVMLAGAVINGVVTSEIITIINSSSHLAQELESQQKLIAEFAQQTLLRDEAAEWLQKVVAARRTVNHDQDREKMMKLFLGSSFPREILGKLPVEMHQGRLMKNRFITLVKKTRRKECPIHLPLFVGIAGNPRHYDKNEIVYYGSDHHWCIFLVLEGTFAHVGSLVPRLATNNRSEPGTPRSTPASSQIRVHSSRVAVPSKFVENHSGALYPYALSGFGNYFGDEEIMLNRRHRRSCVRCESVGGGKVLILMKNDFERLAEEFPDMGALWRSNALRHERFRERAASSICSDHYEYQEFAARQIQECVRAYQGRNQKSQRSMSGSGSGVNCSLALCTHFAAAANSAGEMSMHMTPQKSLAEGPTQALYQKLEHLSSECASLKDSMAQLLEGQRSLRNAVLAMTRGQSPLPICQRYPRMRFSL